jgi:hypothetical protein
VPFAFKELEAHQTDVGVKKEIELLHAHLKEPCEEKMP